MPPNFRNPFRTPEQRRSDLLQFIKSIPVFALAIFAAGIAFGAMDLFDEQVTARNWITTEAQLNDFGQCVRSVGRRGGGNDCTYEIVYQLQSGIYKTRILLSSSIIRTEAKTASATVGIDSRTIHFPIKVDPNNPLNVVPLAPGKYELSLALLLVGAFLGVVSLGLWKGGMFA